MPRPPAMPRPHGSHLGCQRPSRLPAAISAASGHLGCQRPSVGWTDGLIRGDHPACRTQDNRRRGRIMMLRMLAAAAIAAACCASLPAGAADYPAKPITLIIGFAPGGPSDVLARILTRKMEEVVKQPFVIEN